MSVPKAVAKVEKELGVKMEVSGKHYKATYKGHDLSFFSNSYGDVQCISTKPSHLQNDPGTDMFYDNFHSNITKAINSIK